MPAKPTRRTKILKPSAAQAMIVRRYEFLQKTIGPRLWISWDVIPTKRELADHARVYIESAVRNKKQQRNWEGFPGSTPWHRDLSKLPRFLTDPPEGKKAVPKKPVGQ
jgi:hypothetical protein